MQGIFSIRLVKHWAKIAAYCLAGLGVLAFAAAMPGLYLAFSTTDGRLTYKDRPLEAWFYAGRTNFFSETSRKAAQVAIDALGTNGCAFLLAELKSRHGNGPLYFKLYRSLPAWAQGRLPYPLSGDDIKRIALDHISKMPRLPRVQVQGLAACVPGFENPRLRMAGLNLMQMSYQSDPAFLELCRSLINDEHPGIQLEAAISLAESSIVADPREPRLFNILLDGLESKARRKASLDVVYYQYQKQPPGGSGSLPLPPNASRYVRPPDDSVQDRIGVAVERLKLHLTQAQRNRLDDARRAARQTSDQN
jgi:hypothetical protein